MNTRDNYHGLTAQLNSGPPRRETEPFLLQAGGIWTLTGLIDRKNRVG